LLTCQKCGKTLQEDDIVWVEKAKGFIFVVPGPLKGVLGNTTPRHLGCWGDINEKEEG
jgi:hypothetical protein